MMRYRISGDDFRRLKCLAKKKLNAFARVMNVRLRAFNVRLLASMKTSPSRWFTASL